jgi:hypothetical protein
MIFCWSKFQKISSIFINYREEDVETEEVSEDKSEAKSVEDDNCDSLEVSMVIHYLCLKINTG